MTVTSAASDRLADIKKRKNDLRNAIAAATRERENAKQAVLQNGGMADPNSNEFRAAERATSVLASLKEQLRLVDDEERYVLSQVAGLSPDFGAESFLSQPEVLQDLSRIATSSAPIGPGRDLGIGIPRDQVIEMMGGQGKMFSALTPGNVDTGVDSRAGVWRGATPQLQRKLRILDLIPTLPLDGGNTVEYSVETTPASGIDDAAETAEGAVKPSTALDYPDAEAKVKTIAVFTKAKRQQLADLPTLEAIIRNRLGHMVMRRLEKQVLSGDGSGENIRGIYNTTNVGSVPTSGINDADLVMEGLVDVLVSDAEPNGVAIHPRNIADMKLQKGSDQHYVGGGPFSPTANVLWDLPAVPATGAILNRPLVGDFAVGATIFVREGVNIRISDSADDDFTRNKVTILAEGRFALAVWYPAAFSIVELV